MPDDCIIIIYIQIYVFSTNRPTHRLILCHNTPYQPTLSYYSLNPPSHSTYLHFLTLFTPTYQHPLGIQEGSSTDRAPVQAAVGLGLDPGNGGVGLNDGGVHTWLDVIKAIRQVGDFRVIENIIPYQCFLN